MVFKKDTQKFKSKQEQVEAQEFHIWYTEFSKYYDFKEIHGCEPSILSTSDDVRNIAIWALEQDETLKRSKQGENNLMKRNVSVSGTWMEHRTKELWK